MLISLNVNGVTHQVNVTDGMPLLWVIRDLIGLTGTKYGCGIEVCGACAVMVDGQAERSCQFDATSAVGKTIVTVEGLSPDRSHPAQKAWIANQVPQCGYCQSGMLMCAASGIQQGHHGSEIEIDNLCICGTYPRIKQALATL
jgi:isoquinoline 1-oxidoreductase alpha subunit